MASLHLASVVETSCEIVDPFHDSVPVIGGLSDSYPAHTLRKLVLAMSGTSWLDEGLVEVDSWKVETRSPVFLRRILIIPRVKMELQNELCVEVEVLPDPTNE